VRRRVGSSGKRCAPATCSSKGRSKSAPAHAPCVDGTMSQSRVRTNRATPDRPMPPARGPLHLKQRTVSRETRRESCPRRISWRDRELAHFRHRFQTPRTGGLLPIMKDEPPPHEVGDRSSHWARQSSPNRPSPAERRAPLPLGQRDGLTPGSRRALLRVGSGGCPSVLALYIPTLQECA
jgi:hypothetical protein